jgi:hypothetical protein
MRRRNRDVRRGHFNPFVQMVDAPIIVACRIQDLVGAHSVNTAIGINLG